MLNKMRMKNYVWLACLVSLAAISLMFGVEAGVMTVLAAAPAIAVTETPEATVVNPPNQTETGDGSPAVFPEQSVTTGQAAAPEVYEDQYDKLITEVRIARTPLDQITRSSRRKNVIKSMEFKYGSIDYLPIESETVSDYETDGESFTSDNQEVTLSVVNAGIFNRRDLVRVQNVRGYEEDGVTQSEDELKLWVKDRNGNTSITVIAINGKKIGNFKGQVPGIDGGSKLIRIAKACGELDSQAPGYAIYPTTDEQYCQKFMAQVEQSTIDALTAKRFDITLSDQEEATLADMRLGMEGVFLFGTKSKFTDPDTLRNVWTTQGIWSMAGHEFRYSGDAGSASALSVNGLIDICREMFTGPAAGKSNRRIVLCGSQLLAMVQKMLNASQYSTNVYKKWNLEFTEFSTVFGKLEFILAEVFDIHGMAECGMIIDPDYLERYTFKPFNRNTIDFNAQGTRDSKAIVLSEISAVVLKSPKNHARIVGV